MRESCLEISESGWVIEKGEVHYPKYLSVVNRRWDWTHDHLKAIRFARRQDAELIDTHFLLSVRLEEHRACEHSWESSEQPQPSKGHWEGNQWCPSDQPSGSGRTTDNKREEWTREYAPDSDLYAFKMGTIDITVNLKDGFWIEQLTRIKDAHNAALREYKEKAWKYDQLNK